MSAASYDNADVHGFARSMRIKRWLCVGVLALFAAGFVSLVAFAPPAKPDGPETPQQRRMAEVAFLVLGGLCLLGALAVVRRTRRESSVQVRIDAQGLTHRPAARRRAEVPEDIRIAWDAVESFTQQVVRIDYNGILIGTRRLYTLIARDGRTIRLDETIDRVVALADRIARETSARLLPTMQQTIAQGRRVAFGEIEALREGIQYRGATLPWERVERVEVDRYGAIVIRARDPSATFLRIDYAAVPNAHVLIALANY